MKTRSKPLERDQRISKETAEFCDQGAFRTRGKPSNRSKETREFGDFENKEQTARKVLEYFRRRSKPLERN